ncbi:PrgI family protein [Paenibacillus hubeiensis]|uniref:PrgI family protein n=1 Tax=Paenibacillus hubeiensis TaxID=3077330 RepID=UPI0031BAC057
MNYYIPKNVKTRFQIMPGIGWAELLLVLIGAGIGFGIGYGLFLLTASVFSYVITAFFAALGFMIAKPHPVTGKNAVALIKDFQNFKSKQKRYYYRYGSGRR